MSSSTRHRSSAARRSGARLLAAALVAGALATGARAVQEPEPQPPNVLFVLSDQHRGSALGCAGNALAETPNLDRLAAQGVRFSNAIVQVGLCVPSRATIFTGTYPQIHRATHNNTRIPPGQPTWPGVLAERGYRTLAVGRVHGIYEGCEMVPVPGKLETIHAAERVLRGDGDERLGPGEHWDAAIADTALAQLAELRQSDEPWMLYVGFLSPHPPLAAPEPFDRLVSPDAIELPPLDKEALAAQPSWHRNWKSGAPLREEVRRLRMARYMGMVSYVDHEVGRLLDGLDELGLAEDTIVVYTSDHGSPLGAHGIDRKNVAFFETDVNVPLILRAPARLSERLPGGRVVEAPVESIDIAPTLMALLDQPSVPEFLGSDLAPLVRGEGRRARPYTFACVDLLHSEARYERGLMIRDEQWKYVWYTTNEGELYDLRADPGEQRNRVSDPSCEAVRARYAETLLDHLVWLWTVVPERELESDANPGERCALELHDERLAAVLRRGDLGLVAHADGSRRWIRQSAAELAPEVLTGDALDAAVKRELTEALTRRLAVELGPAFLRGEDSGLCLD